MNQSTDTTTNRNMTEAELDAYFQRILDGHTPHETAAMSDQELETRLAELEQQVADGPSLMECALTLGALHSDDDDAAARSAVHFVSLLLARALETAGAR